jgi:tRNA pseudouridine38-40 synthase
MPTYKLTIEYEGTRYSGWQTQVNTSKTVQEHLTRAAIQVLGAQVEIGGAGRTDAGVHAAGQVAHLRAHKEVDALQLSRKMNDLLPHDIHIVGCELTHDRFHARHDADSRIYMYQIGTRRTAFAKPFVWWIKDRLDLRAMQEAAIHFPGRHDFSAFTDRRLAEDESRIVVVDRFDVGRAGDLILVRVQASHFLWKMVRKLVSCLAEVGRGNIDPAAIPAMLHADAESQQETAPPSGLFLEAIVYPGELFERPLEPVVPVTTFAMRRTAPARPVSPPASRPEPRGYDRPRPYDRPRNDAPREYDKPRNDATRPYDKPRPDAPRPYDRPRNDAPRAYDKPRNDAPRPYDRPRSDAPRPYDRPRNDAPRAYDRPRNDAPRPYDRPRPDSAGAGRPTSPRPATGPSSRSTRPDRPRTNERPNGPRPPFSPGRGRK